MPKRLSLNEPPVPPPPEISEKPPVPPGIIARQIGAEAVSQISELRTMVLRKGESVVMDKPIYKPSERPKDMEFINGEVMGVIELPSDQEVGRRIAIVDYGEDYDKKGGIIIIMPDGSLKSPRNIYAPRSRYGLQALNHRDPMDGARWRYAPLDSEGSVVVGGDNMNYAGRDLGLNQDTGGRIADGHFVAMVTPDQKIVITDNSDSGTTVEYKP